MKHNFTFYFSKPSVALLKQFARVLAFCWPRDKNLIAIGAWLGEAYKDSPKYLAEWLLKNTNYKIVWIGNANVEKQLPSTPRMTFARRGTLRAALKLLRAKIWVCCISIEWDLTFWPLEGSALVVNTRHGYGMKKLTNRSGDLAVERASLAGRVLRLLEMHKKTYALVGSEYDVNNLLMHDAFYFDSRKMLRIGTPADDFLIANKNNTELISALKNKYAKLLGFDATRRIVTYFPTWRNWNVAVGAFGALPEEDQLRWQSLMMRQNAVIVEKHHPRTLISFPNAQKSLCSIPVAADRQNEIDVHELLLITDVLISDYSGAIQEYGVMNRPAIHFAYDFDDYLKRGSGLVDGWQNMLAGPLVKDWNNLYNTVENYLSGNAFCRPKEFSSSIEYQTGRACAQFVDFVKCHT